MKNSRAFSLLAAMILGTAAPSTAAETIAFGGYVKNFSLMFSLPRPNEEGVSARPPLLGISNTRLRLKLSIAPVERLSFHLAYDLSPRIQDPVFFRSSPFGFTLLSGGYRLIDFRDPLVPGRSDPAGSFGLYHNLDRLSVTINTGIGDWIIGRQPVAWGSGRLTNPTDVLAPFSFNELDKEERYGVDAVRLRIPIGPLGELDLGYVFGKKLKFEQSAFFLKSKFNVYRTDLTFVLLGFRRDLLLGVDLARSVGGAGVWMETALVVPDAFAPSVRPKPKKYFRLTAGIDGSLTGKTSAFLEYHYNSAGASRPEAYPGLFSTPGYARGNVYLLGRHYLSAGLNHQISALIPATGMIVYNASDRSLAVSPQVEYNAAENIDLAAGVYLGIGKRPGSSWFGDAETRPDPRSEFGSYPDFMFLSFRWYF